MKKNNTAEKTIQSAKRISDALKEGTEKTIRSIIDEAIDNFVKEGGDNGEEEDGYDVQDVNTDEPENTDVTPEEGAAPEGDENAEEPATEEGGAEDKTEGAPEGDAEGDGDAEDDGWSELEDYKVGDNDYDFTGVEGDEILKVYNKLNDDDQLLVKKDGDGKFEVKDDETGAEYVIELDPSLLDSAEDNLEGDGDNALDAIDAEGAEGEDNEISLEIGDEPESDDVTIDINDDEDETNLDEDLGYTDSYQKDVFAKKFNMNEPADSKTTNDWDNGAPKKDVKPWAGKGDTQPFDKKVNECDAPEANQDANIEEDGSGLNTKHAMKKSTNHINRGAQNQKVVSQDGEYMGNINEHIKKIVTKAKAIQAENKQYAEAITKIKQSLYEAAVLNVNLGRLVDILVNETTTKDEKKSICERFNNVKTLAEGKTLHSTIKAELNETKKSAPVIDKQMVAESKSLNETTIYQNTEPNPALDLMHRMDDMDKMFNRR